MKQFYIVLFFFITSLTIAQEVRFSVSYENFFTKEVFDLVEQQSGYDFFYIPEWFEDTTHSGNYQNISLQNWLDSFFSDTIFNFYIADSNRIIITKNVAIIKPNLRDTIQDDVSVIQNNKVRKIRNPIELPVFIENEPITSTIPIVKVYVGKQQNNASSDELLLAGKIINKNTKEPISEASIIVKEANKGAISDSLGNFSMLLFPGEYLIEIRSLGFSKKLNQVFFFSEGSLDIEMDEEYQNLREVIVSTNIEKEERKQLSGVSEVDVEKIKLIPLVLGERDVIKAVTAIAGVDNAGEGALGFNVRGGKEDQNLVLLDGATVYNPQHFFGIFSAINTFAVKDAVLYKGYIPANFGGRLSSVFDITSKTPNKEKIAGEASLGPVTGNVTLEVPISKGKSALLLSGRGVYSNWILRSLDEPQLNRSEASFYDFNLKYDHTLSEKEKLMASAYYSTDRFRLSTDSTNAYQNFTTSLAYKRKLSEKSTLDVLLAHSRYGFDLEFDGQSNIDFEQGYNLSETKLGLQFISTITPKHTLSFGLESTLYRVNPGERNPLNAESIITPLSIEEDRGISNALFISDTYKLNEKWLFDFGVRITAFSALGPSEENIYEAGIPKNNSSLLRQEEFGSGEFIKTYWAPEFRSSIQFAPKPDLRFQAAVNSTYQFLHQLSSNTTVSPLDIWQLTGLNIKPQRGMQYSAGIFKDLGDFEASVEGYYKRSRDILDYKVGAELLLNENLEQEVLQGKGKAYGVEFSIKKNKGFFNGVFNYTFSRSFLQFDTEFAETTINGGDFFPSNFDKPHNLNLFLNYQITRRYSFSINGIYQTGRPVTIPVGTFELNGLDFLLFGDRNTFRLRDFYRVDVSINIEGSHKKKKLAHSFWNISVYNVIGRNNPFSLFFGQENGEIKAFESIIFSVPIPTVSYNLKF